MSNTQEMLEEAITLWGANDIVTVMLSQKMDKEVLEEQSKIYKRFKEEF